jgi:hypothetical protein
MVLIYRPLVYDIRPINVALSLTQPKNSVYNSFFFHIKICLFSKLWNLGISQYWSFKEKEKYKLLETTKN